MTIIHNLRSTESLKKISKIWKTMMKSCFPFLLQKEEVMNQLPRINRNIIWIRETRPLIGKTPNTTKQNRIKKKQSRIIERKRTIKQRLKWQKFLRTFKWGNLASNSFKVINTTSKEYMKKSREISGTGKLEVQGVSKIVRAAAF